MHRPGRGAGVQPSARTSTNEVTSAIKRIRVRLREAGLQEDPITTVHALGYRWEQRDAGRAWEDLGRTG